jgi:hypothetical protein
MKIEIYHYPDLGVEYVVLKDDNGAIRQPDGSIKLAYLPF